MGLALIDYALIWAWVRELDPDPSISIAVTLLVPLVFGINAAIGGVLAFFRKRDSMVFFANALVSSLLMSHLFHAGIEVHQERRLDAWEFTRQDTVFHLTKWEEVREFSMGYIESAGSSTYFLDGTWEKKGDTLILEADSTLMFILRGQLLGFREKAERIPLKVTVK